MGMQFKRFVIPVLFIINFGFFSFASYKIYDQRNFINKKSSLKYLCHLSSRKKIFVKVLDTKSKKIMISCSEKSDAVRVLNFCGEKNMDTQSCKNK